MVAQQRLNVPRSSVAKWPDIGATSSTFGSSSPPSFWKCRRLQNGVDVATFCSTGLARLAANFDAVDVVGGPLMREAGERDHFVIGRHPRERRTAKGCDAQAFRMTSALAASSRTRSPTSAKA